MIDAQAAQIDSHTKLLVKLVKVKAELYGADVRSISGIAIPEAAEELEYVTEFEDGRVRVRVAVLHDSCQHFTLQLVRPSVQRFPGSIS